MGGPRQEDLRWMQLAIDLSWHCPPSETAYSVGAVIVSSGTELARGFSREADPHDHAEEAALGKVPANAPQLQAATLYSTLEPCSQRRSRPRTCTQLILAADIPRVVLAWREPSLFVDDCVGYELLRESGVEVVELPELAEAAKAANAHVLRHDGRSQGPL